MAHKNQLIRHYTPTNRYVCDVVSQCGTGQIVFTAGPLCLGEALIGCRSPALRPGVCAVCFCCAKGIDSNFPYPKDAADQAGPRGTAMECSMCSSMGLWEPSCLGFWKGFSFVCHAKTHDLVCDWSLSFQSRIQTQIHFSFLSQITSM